MTRPCVSVLAIVLCLGGAFLYFGNAGEPAKKDDFATKVKPFVDSYCASCHRAKKPAGGLDLTREDSAAAVLKNIQHWVVVLDRVKAREMPPEDAGKQPTAAERTGVVQWLTEFIDREAARNAGDPGIVLARRLSNAEYDATIRDLVGFDIRPTREFPVDPANQAGFDNSGESLAMSPALLKKYLAAARFVADHVVLKPDGFAFAPHPVTTDLDRDKYCVPQIVDFYTSRNVDIADYFHAAWIHRHREALGKNTETLELVATANKLSPKYLTVIWSLLNEPAEVGPVAVMQSMWKSIPAPKDKTASARGDATRLRDRAKQMRQILQTKQPPLGVPTMSSTSQVFLQWRNSQIAKSRRLYLGEPAADFKKLAEQIKDEAFTKLFPEPMDDDALKAAKTSLTRFCDAIPDAFVTSNVSDKTRPLTAGFHLMHGHNRDDGPLYDLILSDAERREIDRLWRELHFITLSPMRQYKDFIFFERAEPPRYMFEAEFDFARSEDKDCTAQDKIDRLAKLFLAKAVKKGAKGDAVRAIEAYFPTISGEVRKVEKDRKDAEPNHLRDLVAFAEKAYRRPMTKAERDDLLAFYRTLRKELGHEDAIADAVVSVLMSPHFSYRIDLAAAGKGIQPLPSHALASRLSYFLWSSGPDAELLKHAASGELQKPEVLASQAKRMLADPKVRGLATEFAGNWLDIRRFEEHNAVDKDRFPAFTPELRQAMFEEPIRYFTYTASRNRSVLDLITGKDTFVNKPLAKFYGMPEPAKESGKDEWVHVADADKYGRGGLLPMAAFLTKNAPGLRTSPVKRGYWVVKRVLGEEIPPPPPTVPELPEDEAKTGEQSIAQLLAAHRDNKACAGCHRRFDAIGIVFEGFGPVGERRTKDLGGRAIEIAAEFPDGSKRTGVAGLREYLLEKRKDEFVDNLCKKLLTYALGRSLMLSDRQTLAEMRSRLVRDDYAFGSLIETIVTSPQFRTQRGRDYQAAEAPK